MSQGFFGVFLKYVFSLANSLSSLLNAALKINVRSILVLHMQKRSHFPCGIGVSYNMLAET